MIRNLKPLLNRFFAKDIAHTMGVSPSTVGNWKSGRSKPNKENKTVLASLWSTHSKSRIAKTKKQKLKNRVKYLTIVSKPIISAPLDILEPVHVLTHSDHYTYYFHIDVPISDEMQVFTKRTINTCYAYDPLLVSCGWDYIPSEKSEVQFGSTYYIRWNESNSHPNPKAVDEDEGDMQSINDRLNELLAEGTSGSTKNVINIFVLISSKKKPEDKPLPENRWYKEIK